MNSGGKQLRVRISDVSFLKRDSLTSEEFFQMLTVQFGQCGNQLGHVLFSKVPNDLKSSSISVSYAANLWREAMAHKNFRCFAPQTIRSMSRNEK
ncbi:hypothetical protein X777_15064 [Ooceraea biroi]|uniref:Uncharacterized protein n=1 Tax=Ooceraea biroi TaxID=2015173 RepID=A0A026WVV4_OOCBI|nr:hypothetical protein X777_15064 [Ooceraea biroi]